MKQKTIYTIVALLIALIAAVGTGVLFRWNYAVLAAWDAFAFSLLVFTWTDMALNTKSDISQRAQNDDFEHGSLEALTILACLASIGTVIYLISSSHSQTQAINLAIGLLSIVLSWTLIHTLFSLRYIDLFYKNKGVIDFGRTKKPSYVDFLYLAFTIGMTYQVSDATILDSRVRKIALLHAVLSFIFGTTIIASTINLVINLSAS